MCTESNNLLRVAVHGVRSSNEPCTLCLFKAKRNMDILCFTQQSVPLSNGLRSIMGWPGGMSTIRCTRLVLEISSFRLSLYISGGKAIIITRHNDLFSHYNLILRKLFKKMPQKALINTKQNVLMPPWAYHNTP